MFARLFAVGALAAFAVAQECTTGPIKCCDSTFPAEHAHDILSQIGINLLADVTGLAASGCSPLSLVGVGNNGASCSQQPVCCNNNVFGGLIDIGCSLINVGL